jgi:hypothetical protein
MKSTLNKKLMTWGVFIALLLMTSLTSCSRYIVDRSSGGACGVWFPKIFNPNRGGGYENPRGAQGW